MAKYKGDVCKIEKMLFKVTMRHPNNNSIVRNKLLLKYSDKLGLTADELMPMADNLGILSFIIPEDGLQRTLELQTLVQMMMQDGHVHDREYSLCLEYASRIGFGKAVLDDMIQQFSANPES